MSVDLKELQKFASNSISSIANDKLLEVASLASILSEEISDDWRINKIEAISEDLDSVGYENYDIKWDYHNAIELVKERFSAVVDKRTLYLENLLDIHGDVKRFRRGERYPHENTASLAGKLLDKITLQKLALDNTEVGIYNIDAPSIEYEIEIYIHWYNHNTDSITISFPFNQLH